MFEDTSVGSIIWLICLIVVSIGGVIVELPSITPRVVSNLFLFGKARTVNKWNLTTREITLLPKRWFSHFYAVGILSTLLWIFALAMKINTGRLPYVADMLVQAMRYPLNEGKADLVLCYIVLTCIGLQVTRRFLECLTISVYSKEGKMSIAIYLIGVGFYFGLSLSCVAGSNLQQEVKLEDVFTQFGSMQIIGVALFIIASGLQNGVAKRFASLRCNKNGAVVNDKHHIPSGGMFEYISCPHYLAEILIYISFTTIFAFTNPMLNYLLLFVIANQFVSAHYTHKWYKENFPKFPKKRKAIFPFVY